MEDEICDGNFTTLQQKIGPRREICGPVKVTYPGFGSREGRRGRGREQKKLTKFCQWSKLESREQSHLLVRWGRGLGPNLGPHNLPTNFLLSNIHSPIFHITFAFSMGLRCLGGAVHVREAGPGRPGGGVGLYSDFQCIMGSCHTPVNRQTRLKALPSRNFVGGR